MSEPSSSARPPLRLVAGAHRLDLVPWLGGSIAAFHSDLDGRRVDWLRPTPDEALASGDRLQFASFPLVPWCNRIRDGRATFEGRSIALPPHRHGVHTLHGLGWDAEWTVDAQSERSLSIRFDGGADGGGWPWRFEATQRFDLDAEGLTLTLAVRNLDEVAMPAGLGHHPYFPLDDDTVLTADVDGRWLADAELLPVRRVADQTVAALRAGVRVAGLDLDGVFTGWNRRALVRWSDRSLRLDAGEGFDFFHYFHPPGGRFFCAEPVSNITDWLNLGQRDPDARAGGTVLPPGGMLSGTVRMTPVGGSGPGPAASR